MTAVSQPRRLSTALGSLALVAPAVLSCLLLAAHYTRSFQPHLMLLFLLLPALLLVTQSWSARIMQGLLLFGAFEWVTTALLLMGERQATGEAYGRMLAILLGVAAFTVVSAAIFEAPRLRRRYGLRTKRLFQ